MVSSYLELGRNSSWVGRNFVRVIIQANVQKRNFSVKRRSLQKKNNYIKNSTEKERHKHETSTNGHLQKITGEELF